MIGTVSILFLMSAGLELFVRQAFRQADITTVLLALALAAWSSVLGIVGLVLLSFWWVVRQVREPINKATLARDEAPSSTRAAEAGAQLSRVNGVLP